jgi:hypothetical protein
VEKSGVKERHVRHVSIPWADKQADLGAAEQHSVLATLHELDVRGWSTRG